MSARGLLVLLASLSCGASFGADEYSKTGSTTASRYTFSWPLDNEALKPRGGTTKGAPVTLDHRPSSAWRALREKNLSAFERDRRAILAMAGTYRVTFDFLEVAPFGPEDEPGRPYQSWGTEKIYVDRDDGRFISLVHILEMHVVQEDGSTSEPIVTKHWRQDWQYEPSRIVQYRGKDRWERSAVSPSQSRGAWLQSVYQVDESPRYASIGRWEHSPSFSTWLSGETWRPLPRREWSVRDDYDVLVGTNRHTILPDGWIQEENNLKTVLTDARELDPERPYLAREYGVARYERIKDADFAAADRYYERTRAFWNQVRDRWSELFASRGTLTLRGPVDKLGLFEPLFAHAEVLEEQGSEGAASARNGEVIEAALREMGVE
ncbi:MAG TPA: DUF6607 family protein [Steroidobacteraceae bacterium]|jgi:hypothetical protein